MDTEGKKNADWENCELRMKELRSRFLHLRALYSSVPLCLCVSAPPRPLFLCASAPPRPLCLCVSVSIMITPMQAKMTSRFEMLL